MVLELLKEGGPVVWVILAGGVLALAVFFERSLHLHRARIRADDFLRGIVNILKRNNAEEALAICEETPGPVAAVVRTAVLHRKSTREEVRAAVNDAALAETSRMERRLVVVATVAQLAPLLGLLGTVLGMIEMLLALRAGPIIQYADVMGGMMRALVATAAGLSVAIPCYGAFNLLVLKVDRLVVDMERVASEITLFVGDASAH